MTAVAVFCRFVFRGRASTAGYVANAMEQVLLLLKDMDELWNLKKHELFLSVKRDLALVRFPYTNFLPPKIHYYSYMHTFLLISISTIHAQATQATHVIKEWVDQAFCDLKEKESKHYATQNSLTLIDNKLKETLLKLVECDKARKSPEASIESTKRQAREQFLQLREVKSQLAIARTTIFELKKELS